jgi:tetratricopeptide (TPR) repeat protein
MAAPKLQERPAGPDGKWTVLGVCVLLALAVFAVFGQTLRHEFVNWDDDVYVYQNPVVIKGLTFQGISQVFTHRMCDFYHPLTMVSLMLDHQVYGLNAGGYHLTNVLLHAANAVLLFLVLRRLMRLRSDASSPQVGLRSNNSIGAVATPAGALWPSAFVAAVFALHPLRVESVAWVTERKDVLSGLFFVLMLGAYVQYVEKFKVQSSKSRIWYGLMLLSFTLGLLSKPSLVTLPFVLLLLDYWPLDRMALAASRSTFKILSWLIIEKIPLFVLSAASSVATIFTQQHMLAPVGGLPLFSRAGYAAVSYVVYLGQMIYPAGLAAVYPYPEKGLPLAEVTLAVALLAGLSVGVLALRRRCPYLVVGWLWYLGMLVPMIGMVHVGSVARADRFTYLAQLGVYIMLAWAARDLTISWRYGRRMLGVGALSVIAALMVCTWKQTSYWRNSETLWTHTLAYTSGNSIAHNNLGVTLMRSGRLAEALEHYQKALQINPGDADAHINLGNALLQKGNVDEAMAHYQEALEIKPDSAEACYDLGNVLLQKGKVDEAITHYQKALQIKPDYADAQNNLGNALFPKGSVDEAITHYQKALEVKPDSAKAQNNLGNALLQKGNVDEAIEHFQKALEIKPDFAEAQNNLGNALVKGGQVDEAMAHYQKAIQLKPDYAEAHYNLANMLAKKDQLVEAIAHYKKAIQFNPDYAEAHYNLGAVFGVRGRLDEAIEQYQKAIQIKPDYADAHGNLANVLTAQGRLEEAIPEYRRTLELVPDSAQAHFRFGQALQAQRNFEAAIKEYQKALDLAPRHLPVHLSLAWLLATCPEATLRDGGRAVELAQQAERLGGGESPQVLDTLAAAYAEAGRYPEAVETAKRALNLTATQNNQPLAEAIQNRLKLYEAGSPYHEKP